MFFYLKCISLYINLWGSNSLQLVKDDLTPYQMNKLHNDSVNVFDATF